MKQEERARNLCLLGLLAALALAIAAAWPLLTVPGMVNTRAGGDSPFLLQRVYDMQANMRAGALPARWMPNAAYGLGYPFFNYYASLPYYLAAGLSLAGAGVLWAIKLTQLIGFLAAAAAMYGLVLDLTHEPWAALAAAAAYTFAPFHMVNVYVRGDSLSEFYAFVFYALIVWSIVRLRRAPTIGHVAMLAASYASLMVTHTVSAMIFSPLAGLVILWATLTARERRWLVFLGGAAAIVLGLALSAWYWVPALGEQGAVSLTDMTTGYFNYSGHFRWRDLLQPGLLFDYAFEEKRTPFAIGGLQAGLIVLGLALAVAGWVRDRRPRWVDLSLLPLLAYAVWPITPSSAIAWDNLPLLPMAQFPWRFLSITALATALVVGVGASRLGRLRWLAGLVALAAAASGLALLRPEVLPIREADVTAERLQLYEHITGNIGSTVRAEYLPAEAAPRPYTSAALITGQAHPAPVAVEGALGEATLLAWAPEEQRWQVDVEAPDSRLAFQTYAFPGWQADVDGEPATLEAGAGGRITLSLDEGRHEVVLRLGSTPLQSTAERASLAATAVAAALALAGLWRARRQWRRMLAGLGVVAGVLALTALSPLAPQAAPTTLPCETMDFERMPYLHANPEGVLYGNAVRLLGYEVKDEADPGDTLHLRLHWEFQGSEEREVLVHVTTAADRLFAAPALATYRAPLAATTEHEITVPAEVSPGLALLAVEVRGPEGTIGPRIAQGEGLGTTYLAPVRVSSPPPTPGITAQAHLGKYLDLLQAEVSEPKERTLLVRLTWRPALPLPEDYVASVKLWDAEGRPVPGAARDVPPRYGLYPTSLWPVGIPVADYYQLRVPAGTPPGPGYQVEVTLYQARTLEPIGRIMLPDITLTRPTINSKLEPQHEFAGGLGMAGWKLEREEVHDGESLQAELQWTALATPLPNATARLSLHDTAGQEVAASEAAVSPHYPPSRWPEHAMVNGRLALHVPPGTAPGTYALRLELFAEDGRSLGQWASPGEVSVTAAERNTTLPEFSRPLGVTFGGLIGLPGYDLEEGESELALTFHWQAAQAPGRDYKVFVHCYDAEGEIIAQRDAMPLGDTYPTSRWAAGEVVSDRLALDMADVPPGRYELAVGWYDPSNGERLEPTGGSAEISDRRVMLGEVEWPGS